MELKKEPRSSKAQILGQKPLFLTIDHKLSLRRRKTEPGKPLIEPPSPIPNTDTEDDASHHGSTERLVSKDRHEEEEEEEMERNQSIEESNDDATKSTTTPEKMDNTLNSSKQIVLKSGRKCRSKMFAETTTRRSTRYDRQDEEKGKMLTLAKLACLFKTSPGRMANRVLINSFMAIFMTVVQVYTYITLPVYFFVQKPWQKRAADRRLRIKVDEASMNAIAPSNNPEVLDEKSMSLAFVRDQVVKSHPLISLDTLTEVWDNIVEHHGADYTILGHRQILSEEETLDEHGNARRMDGRQLNKYRLSDYQWLNFGQVNSVVKSLAQGLMSKGVQPSDKVLIISETRIEWMLSAHAIVRCGATIVTLFSNLGIDGVAHGIMETEARTVITSPDCVPLLKRVLNLYPTKVQCIIYIDGYKKPEFAGFSEAIDVVPLSEIEKIGRDLIDAKQEKAYYRATPEHLMCIMYTSGTTGTPKGALMTHRQFIGSVRALFVLVQGLIETAPRHTYIAYLPMAHVLELTVQLFLFFGGVKIGYASPFTLTDSAPGLARGEKPDIKLLQPSVMVTVPLVLDRILKEVNEKLRLRTPISQPIFRFLMDYKALWTQRGYDCGIVRRLLCSKVREQLGGGLEYVIVGGAPLNANTQATIKSALDVTLVQGYGATETMGACLCMDFDDLSYGCVGIPLDGVRVRLRDWSEGGYFHTDKPNPRGEILIGGDLVAEGYYKLPRQSDESFYIDRNGVRWFISGDIGEIHPNGTVKIIDRRKDLIKLQNGEYISLGKVEAALKNSQFVDNICVYGGTFSSDIVALVSPNQKSLNELCLILGKAHLSLVERCRDYQIEAEVYADIVKTAKAANLGKKEVPLRIRMLPDEWSPDNGILTAALKLKRKSIEKRYEKELKELYDDKKIQITITGAKGDVNNNNGNNDANNNRVKTTNGTNLNRMLVNGNVNYSQA